MLMLQKAYAEGMRALVLYTATYQDTLQVAAASGTADVHAAEVNDLLLPVVKGVGSERAYELLTLSLQTLGGSGYLQDYPIEQYIRDAKIDSLYEGTTAIQGMDLYFRKIVRNDGAALRHLPGRDQELRRRRAGQRPAQGRARCAGQGRRRRRGHGDRHARLPGRHPRSSPPRSTGSASTPPGC